MIEKVRSGTGSKDKDKSIERKKDNEEKTLVSCPGSSVMKNNKMFLGSRPSERNPQSPTLDQV
jgi:hypothetical protein